MGKGFDTFMENPYWRKQYEDAPSENLKEYYRIMFDTSGFVSGEDKHLEKWEKRLEELPLSVTDIEYLQKHAGMGMARAHYQKYIDKLNELGNKYSVPAAAFQAELRNPYYQVFPQLQDGTLSSQLTLSKTVNPAEFEVIRERMFNFSDDPDDYLIIDLKLNKVDAIFLQTKRHGELCYVEIAYDKQLSRQCSPLIVGKELTFEEATNLIFRFCVRGENIGYTMLFNEEFQVIRFRPTAAEHWEVIENENGDKLYEGFVKNGKPYGAGTVFYPNGVVYQEGVFGIKGLICGNEYYPNGELRFEGLYSVNSEYGPNFPLFGRYYDDHGIREYEGKFRFKRTGVGYPIAVEPENYGPVPQREKPKVKWTMWEDVK